MRFLHIKRAYVVDATYTYEVERDLMSNSALLDSVYGVSLHDVCAITENGEWLVQGKKIDPTIFLKSYAIVFVYIHSPNNAYDRAQLMCKAYAEKHVMVYKATDAIAHHAERLASLIETYKLEAKIPHQIHVDLTDHNQNFTPSEIIAGKHIRNVFLPVHVIPSLYRLHVPDMHKKLLANNHAELSEHIDSLRHANDHITLRSQITGESIFIAAIPGLREKKIYITMPLISKTMGPETFFIPAQLKENQKKELHNVVFDISHILFPTTGAVFALQAHPKRGVFVQATAPLYFFMLHNHNFLQEISETHGIPLKNLFESMI